MELFHVTALTNLVSIAEHGLRPGAYLSGDDDLTAYYKETVEEEGLAPAVLVVELSDLDRSALEPDYPGIAEPITTAISLSESEVEEAWAAADGSWEDSLEIIKSVRYRSLIPGSALRVVIDGEAMALHDYLKYL